MLDRLIKLLFMKRDAFDRMIKRVSRAAACSICVLLATGAIGGDQPCAPFEGGRVDSEMLAAMRAAAAEGRMYRVDTDVSKVGFCVRHFPFQEFRGEFTNIIGGLAFPPEPASYGQALLLIRTSSLQSDNTALVPIVTGSNFMDTANYPEILYVGRRFEWLTEVHAHIYGDLSVRGRTHPVIFDVDIDVPDDTNGEPPERIRLRGRSHVSRFNFDIRSYRLVVSDTIQLCLAAELVRWGF